MSAIKSFTVLSRGVVAGSRLFARLLDALLGATVQFYSTTPSGRILNRVAEIGQIDEGAQCRSSGISDRFRGADPTAQRCELLAPELMMRTEVPQYLGQTLSIGISLVALLATVAIVVPGFLIPGPSLRS